MNKTGLLFFVCCAAAFAQPAKTTLFVGAWPGKVLVIDEATHTITKQLPLKTGVARNMLLSTDKKRIVITTLRESGIEIIDTATQQVVDTFQLNTSNTRVRFGGVALDPTGRLLYAVITIAEKQIDRFAIGQSKFAVIDLDQKKIVRTADYPKDEFSGGGRGQFRVSPDGKTLYQFGENVLVFNIADFKLLEKIELSRPLYPGMESIGVSSVDDPHDPPGIMTGIFNSTDPVVHRRVFGIAQFDLNNRKWKFDPVGTPVTGMVGFRLSPDRKTGYTVAIEGEHGDRRTEFWVFDIASRRVVRKGVFQGRTRFTFGSSTDGKNLYIYGAGNTIEVYDAVTLKMVKDLDVNADMTTPLVAVLPAGARASR
jgi:DNA-binding beta-propeller fold protein YncE